MQSTVQPGMRVRVRFAGRLVDALVVQRRRTSDHAGSLRPIERLISPDVVCDEHMFRLIDQLAERSAGTVSYTHLTLPTM